MIKIFIGFVVFSALAMYILFTGGDIDMSGEKHGVDASHTEEAAPAAPTAPAPAAAPAAPTAEPVK